MGNSKTKSASTLSMDVIPICEGNCQDGFGKIFHTNGQVKYEGQFQGGKFHGKGLSFFQSGNLRYEGCFENGQPKGEGKLYHKDGKTLFIEGEFNGKFLNGKGKMYQKEDTYEGEFINGLYHGFGILNGTDREGIRYTYEGQFQGGKFHGNGILKKKGKLFYDGVFQNNFYSFGKLFDVETSTLKYEGTFVNDHMKTGTMYDTSGKKLRIGQFKYRKEDLENGVERIGNIWFSIQDGKVVRPVASDEEKIISTLEVEGTLQKVS